MGSNDTCRKEVRTVFDCMSPRSGLLLATLLADIMADGLDTDQITVLAAFIGSIADSLGYIAAQMALNEQILSRQNEKETTPLPAIPPTSQ